MKVDVTTQITIARPVAVVAGFAADPSNVPKWYVNIRSVEWQTEPRVAVGSAAAFVARFMGRTLSYTYRIEAFEPHRRLTMRTAEGPFPMETTYTWEALDESTTLMKLRNRGSPTGFSAILAPFMQRSMRRATQNDLERLKQVLES